MKRESYSTYEAKARLSELLRKVRTGQVVTLTHRGEPIAEIRPIDKSESKLEGRLSQLASQGVLQRAAQGVAGPAEVTSKPGALQRFLQDRE